MKKKRSIHLRNHSEVIDGVTSKKLICVTPSKSCSTGYELMKKGRCDILSLICIFIFVLIRIYDLFDFSDEMSTHVMRNLKLHLNRWWLWTSIIIAKRSPSFERFCDKINGSITQSQMSILFLFSVLLFLRRIFNFLLRHSRLRFWPYLPISDSFSLSQIRELLPFVSWIKFV
jgi:hypothetical protein